MCCDERSDYELISAAQSDSSHLNSSGGGGGGNSSFSLLWIRHSEFAARAARSFVSATDAEDVVAEAFMRVFERIRAGGGPTGDFRSYLFVTIRNLAAEWVRSRREFTQADDRWVVELVAATPSQSDSIMHERALWSYQSLTERWQEILLYSEVEGLTISEIAIRMGMSANAVSQLVFRAREGLREAWIQAHVWGLSAYTARTQSECRWSMDRMGAYERNRLGHRDRTRFSAHTLGCPSCGEVLTVTQQIASRLPQRRGGGSSRKNSMDSPSHSGKAVS
ncbi:sigma-70 family RNA polymerase sigma factor [Lysinibacter sp. HNR]|nr:sigma-70 family RNA polymerase sigma factor [Lysinibacter sp. HNR]WGD38669.1 sigma-70 family RNA polymerase sigma factor [Lysinibacter sp. HNR]